MRMALPEVLLFEAETVTFSEGIIAWRGPLGTRDFVNDREYYEFLSRHDGRENITSFYHISYNARDKARDNARGLSRLGY